MPDPITLGTAIAALIRFDRSPFRRWLAQRSANRIARRAAKAAVVLTIAATLGGCATYDRANVWLYDLTNSDELEHQHGNRGAGT